MVDLVNQIRTIGLRRFESMHMPEQTAPQSTQIDRIRAFNRFYTREIGVLREGLLDSPFPLTHARVLFELAQRAPTTAREIATVLALDAGYLSRILRGFVDAGLVQRERSPRDARSHVLRLTPQGREAFDRLDHASRQAATALLSPLDPGARAIPLAMALCPQSEGFQ